MPYENDLQRYLDIFALSLSLKENNTWRWKYSNTNYPILFSLYIQMIEQDQQEFFTRSTDKKQIIQSLERSKNFYTFTHEKQLLRTLQQMETNSSRDFILLPLFYSVGEHIDAAHLSGMLIYKETEAYKVILVDKQSLMTASQINIVNIPSENLNSLCSVLFSNKDNPNIEESYSILYDILEQSSPREIIQLPYQLHPQKEGNCIVKGIEATLKVALFHCRYDLYVSQNFKKIKWNDDPESTIKMYYHFLSAIKKECNGPSEPFDLLFMLYRSRKLTNKRSHPLTIEKKETINQEIKMKMKEYPEIQQILEGKNVYKFSNGIVNQRSAIFEKLASIQEKKLAISQESNVHIKTKSESKSIIR